MSVLRIGTLSHKALSDAGTLSHQEIEEQLAAVTSTAAIKVKAPILLNPVTREISISDASADLSGAVTTAPQSFSGTKTFVVSPVCTTAPVLPEQLANKGYVDTLAQGLTWQVSAIGFIDISTLTPAQLSVGDRYIADRNAETFTKDYIYQWSNLNDWIEIVPVEGNALYISGDTGSHTNSTVVYNGSIWTSLGSTILHNALIGAGTLTHATIDSYLNQAIRTTSSPSFASMAITDTTSSTSPTSGALTVAGGVGITENLNVGGLLRVTDTTESSTSLTGCATFAGGVGIAGALRVGNFMQSTSRFEVLNATEASSTGGSIRTNGGISAIKGGYFGGNVVLASTTASTSSATGALTVAGGVGIGDAAYIGGVIESGPITTRISAAGDAASFLYPGASIGGSSVSIVIGKSNAADEGIRLGYKHQTAGSSSTYLSLGIIGREGMRINGARNTQFTGGVSTAGALTVLDTTASTAATTGALTVAGGVGIAGNEYVGGLLRVTDATASTSSSTGSTVTNGGLGVGGAINAAGSISSGGSVSCSGDATVTGRVTAATMTCTTAPSADTDVVRYTDLTSYSPSGDLAVNSVTAVDFVDGNTVIARDTFEGNNMRLYSVGASKTYIRIGSDSGDYNWGGARFDWVGTNSPLNTMSFGIGDSTNPLGLVPVFTIGATNAQFPQTTESSSTTTGCSTFAGGIGVAKNGYFGGDLYTIGAAHFTGGIETSNPQGFIMKGDSGNFAFKGFVPDYKWSVTTTGGVEIFTVYNQGTDATCKVGTNRTSTSTTTGSFVVAGGIGVGENVNVGGRVTATTMTCSTVPTETTDVVRLGDLSTYLVQSYTFQEFVHLMAPWDVSDEYVISVDFLKTGRQCMLQSRPNSSISLPTVNSNGIEWSYVLPASLRPMVEQKFNVCGALYEDSVPIDIILSIATDGIIRLSRNNNPTTFTVGAHITIPNSITVSWISSS